jgi:hypothetical protein
MGKDLHNLGTVLNELAPALLGVPPGGGAWQSRKFPAGEPVVELVGDRASGKTALIDALHEGYHALVPTARADLGELPYSAAHPADRDRLELVNASPVTHLLFRLSYELHRTHGNRTLAFPRLAPALLLLTAWRPEPPPGNGHTDGDAPEGPPGSAVWPAQLAEAEGELRTLLGSGDSPAPERAGGGPLDVWLRALTGVVGGLLPGVPGLQGILDAGIETLRHRGAAQPQWQWWCGRLHHFDGDGVQRLFSLVQDFRAGGDLRRDVESHLIAALLTDIDAGYGYWASRNLHPPLLLLDNVDERLRSRFLDPFVHEYGAYRQGTSVPGRKPRGRTVLPVVFATSLGNGRHSAGGRLHPATDPAPWTNGELCPPRSWLLRLGIPRVTRAEIRQMLAGIPQPAALALVVERLSGGRTGCALLVSQAVARLPKPADLDLGTLLSLPSPGTGQWLGERMLEMLLPDERVRAGLRTLSPALDPAAAEKLVPLVAPSAAPGLWIRELTDDTLGLAHWDHRPWPRAAHHGGPLVTDRALRAVLLHELREREAEERWAQVHTRLADHYNQGDVRAEDSHGHSPGHLHHALALGRLDTVVVRAMHHRYATLPPAQWLNDLNLVAAAPPARHGYAGTAPAPASDCRDCREHPAGPGAGRNVHMAIRNLLVTVWRLSGPPAEPPTGYVHKDVSTVGMALQTLCTDYGARLEGGDAPNAFVDALARDGWPGALIDGAQAPDLPVRGR